MLEDIFTTTVYDQMSIGVMNTAKIVIPRLMEKIHPASVIDVGCGDGSWLKAFEAHGVTRVFGLDGPHALQSLKIDPKHFLACDLNSPPSSTRNLTWQFHWRWQNTCQRVARKNLWPF